MLVVSGDSSRLYLIEILHQTTTYRHSHNQTACCILSKFYIKPQPVRIYSKKWKVVSYRNSTSNHNSYVGSAGANYVVSYRNSTSNHNISAGGSSSSSVVSYRNSTSNHNNVWRVYYPSAVVSYRNSTSNHNSTILLRTIISLYLIEILHQTTTI